MIHRNFQVSPGKDFSGPFQNSIFMIIVDTHSKWLEMFCMSQITTQATVTRLRRLFTSYGLQIVTDNTTSFMSGSFRLFVSIKEFNTPPEQLDIQLQMDWQRDMSRPSRQLWKKLISFCLNTEDKTSLFLLQYRSTPSCTSGQSPVLHHHVRTRLDFLKPKDSISRRIAMTAVQQNTPLKWTTLCIYKALGNTREFLAW